MSDLLTRCQQQQGAMIDLLTALIETESYTSDKAAVDRLATDMQACFEALGAVVERFPEEEVGDMLLARWNSDAPGKPITLLTHMDTVWPVGTLARRPIHIENGRLYGPGSIDMKAGLTVTLSAIEVLQAHGEFPYRPIWVLATTDEEVGSCYSEGLIRKIATQSGLVLVMEPATPEGALKTWRKGINNFVVRASGRASHAGGAPEAGINAIVELAHQVIKLHGLNDLPNGTSVSVTMIEGGHTNNVIPDRAELFVDMRYLTQAAGERVADQIRALQPVTPGAQLFIESRESRPPLERDDKMIRAFAQAKAIGKKLGLDIREGGSGGGSDGNFTASIGIPTLDGMGPTGDGLHAEHENVLISSLPEKTALVAAILRDWAM